MGTRRWSPADGAEALRPPDLRQHADRSGPLPSKHISGRFVVTARMERSEAKNMRLEPSAARPNVVTGIDRGRQGLMEVNRDEPQPKGAAGPGLRGRRAR
jgi:hypothetical protein